MRQFLWLWLAALLCACSPEAPTTPTEIPEMDIVQEGPPVLKKTPVPVFPEATKVKLFVSTETNLNPVFKESDGIVLTDAQRAKIASAFSYIDVLEGNLVRYEAACVFDPHHFLRYYDASGKVIGEVKICFCCGRTKTEPDVFTNELYSSGDPRKTWEIDQSVLYSLVKEMGLEPMVGCRN